VDAAPVDPRLVGSVRDRVAVTVPERDVRRGVLVDQRVEEDRLERADAALAVDERDLAQPSRAVVGRGGRAKCVGALFRVDRDGAPSGELDADAGDDRAGQLEWHRRAHVAVDALGIGRREGLFGRDVRKVPVAVHRPEVARLPRGRRKEADREIGAGAVQAE
jgi:hypothetical protein